MIDPKDELRWLEGRIIGLKASVKESPFDPWCRHALHDAKERAEAIRNELKRDPTEGASPLVPQCAAE